MGVSVTKDQYDRACSVDLYEFLVQNHPSAVKVEYGSVLLLADKHVSVKRGYHGYRNFRYEVPPKGVHDPEKAGNNVDYLMYWLGYSYQDAVLALIGESGADSSYVPVVNPPIPETKEITLPKPLDGRYKNLYAYMISRKIPSETIQMLIDKGILYQSAEGNNIVFVNPQGDYCEMRGTNSYADRRCSKRKECERYTSGEHTWCTQMETCAAYKPDPFHGCRKTRPDRFWYLDSDPKEPTKHIYVCEAAMDAVSLYVIHQRQHVEGKGVYVSIGGVANQQTIDRISRWSKNSNVVLAVDNDQAGQDCRDRNPDLAYILPKNKDWNDDLKKGDY